ncbi:MAG: hypothetical protein ACP5GL_07450 [Infirmifilum sp.]
MELEGKTFDRLWFFNGEQYMFDNMSDLDEEMLEKFNQIKEDCENIIWNEEKGYRQTDDGIDAKIYFACCGNYTLEIFPFSLYDRNRSDWAFRIYSGTCLIFDSRFHGTYIDLANPPKTKEEAIKRALHWLLDIAYIDIKNGDL